MADLEKRDFKGIWIPKEVWIDANLNALDKMILMEIDSLDNGEGCYASNKYLAEFCICSERKISDTINKLAAYGSIEVVYLEDNHRVIKSNVTYGKNCETLSQNLREGVAKSARGGSKICDKETVDKNNRLETVEENIYVTPRFTKPTVAEIRGYCLERDNNVDPEKFYDYYEATGWMVGKKKMKDWKATVRYWEKKDKKKTQSFEEMFQ